MSNIPLTDLRRNKKFKRPRRIVFTFKCSFTDKIIGEIDEKYDPVKMLNKKYSLYVHNWKRLMEKPYREAGMLFGKIKTTIELVY